MKIALITEHWPPAIGGIENYLLNTAIYLRQAGHEVTVIVPKGKQTDVNNNELAASSLPVIRKKFFSSFIRPRWWFFYRWAKQQAQKENWQLILGGKALFAGIIGYLLKKKLAIPYVIFTYGMEIETWQQSWPARLKLKLVLRQADRVFCLNNVTKAALINLGVAASRIVKAWPGVSDNLLSPSTAEEINQVLAKYNLSQPYIISVGRLIDRKGFDFLIEAFSQIDQTKYGDTQLVIVGDGPLLDHLQSQVEADLIDNSVIFLPDIPDQDLRPLYAGAVLFVLTPKQSDHDLEGFGIVYLEAAAQGIPSIGSRVGGVPEAIIDGGTGIVVKPNDVAATRKAMERILSDNDFSRKLGRQARQRVRAKFTWKKRIEIIQNAIGAVTNNA